MPRCLTSSANSRGVQWVHRSATVGGWLAGHGQDLRHLLGGELTWAAAARQVAEQFGDGVGQSRFLLAAFHEDQSLPRIRPASPPDADSVAFAAYAVSDVLVVQAVKAEQNHACPLGDGLRAGAGACHRLQDFLLAFRNNDLGSPPWHRSNLPKESVKVGRLGKYRKIRTIVEGRFSQGVLVAG